MPRAASCSTNSSAIPHFAAISFSWNGSAPHESALGIQQLRGQGGLQQRVVCGHLHAAGRGGACLARALVRLPCLRRATPLIPCCHL